MLEPINHPFPASEKKPSTSLDGLGARPCSSILDLVSSGKLLGRKMTKLASCWWEGDLFWGNPEFVFLKPLTLFLVEGGKPGKGICGVTGHFSPHLTPFSVLGKGGLPSKIIGQRQLLLRYLKGNQNWKGDLSDCSRKRKLSEKWKLGGWHPPTGW